MRNLPMSIPFAQLRLLIVEDHKFTRLLLKEGLQNLGCQQGNLYEAENGEAGLEVLSETPVDLVICDWQMEPMDGLTFVRKLRDPQSGRNPFIPIILCSAHTDRDLIERAVDAGVNEILTKPITVKAIESRINMIFGQPRPFVHSTQYFGPDRRRRADGAPPFGERRHARRTVIKQVAEGESVENSRSAGGTVDDENA